MPSEQPDAAIPIESRRRCRHQRAAQAGGLFTIKDVGDACGLPNP